MVYLRARWFDGSVGRFTQVDPWSGNHQQPLTMNPYLYALANPGRKTDPTGHCPSEQGIREGDFSYSCDCGWIDWRHASPRTAKQFLQRVFAEIEDVPIYSGRYKAIWVNMGRSGAGVSRYAVVRKNLSVQEKKEVALGIFKELAVEFENYQGTSFFGLQEFLRHTSFSEEDLPSNLIGFYVALELARDPSSMQEFRRIRGPQLQQMVRPVCGALNNDRHDISFSLLVWSEGYQCEKNYTWRPRLARSCFIDGLCEGLGRSWPAKYRSIFSEPPMVGGKWWWHRGHSVDGGLVTSDIPHVYYLWSDITSAPPEPGFPSIPTPTPTPVP